MSSKQKSYGTDIGTLIFLRHTRINLFQQVAAKTESQMLIEQSLSADFINHTVNSIGDVVAQLASLLWLPACWMRLLIE